MDDTQLCSDQLKYKTFLFLFIDKENKMKENIDDTTNQEL